MRPSKSFFGAALFSFLICLSAHPAIALERAPQVAPAANPRIIESLDRDWTFQYFPQTAPDSRWAQPHADDSAWPAIALPHTWSVYETTRDLHPFIRHATERDDSYWWYGRGWYRKHFTLAQDLSQREVFLEFDGVQKVSFIYVNGHLAGEHRGGYTSFSFDVTRWINFGGDNLIAVQVSNRRDDSLGHVPPMTAGNFDVYGGIYRSVRLVLTNKVHIPFQGSADSEGGDFIQTPHVSAESATVHDTTWLRNDSSSPASIELRSQIVDADGRILAAQATPSTIAPGQLASVAQDFAPIAQPHLWSPSTPYLYRMITTVVEQGVEIDRFESTFGLRFFSWNKAEERLYLNGAPIRLIGTNRHQDFPWLGDAVPIWLQLRDLHDMLNMGYNFQRTAHYTQAPAIYDFCDRNGIIVAEESPNIKDLDFGRDVQKQTLVEMIRRDRNHPSIFFWSIGNETDHPADSAWAWSEDQSRIINLRRGTNGGSHVMTTDEDLPLEQTLRCTIRGWYNEDAHNFSPGTGEPLSGQVTGTEEWQHATDARYLLAKRGANIVVFLYADHGADRIYKQAPLENVNPKGWVDDFRFPKYVYYLWQANFTQKAMVFIHSWPWQQRYVGKKEPITVDSNADSVELFVDGRSLGVKHPTEANAHVVEFPNVEVTGGVIQAVARKGTETVEDTIHMPGAPVKLQLTVRDAHLTADRAGLALLDVNAVDAKGEPVPYIHPDIHWSVEGQARLVGPADYTTDTDKDDAPSGTMYIVLPTANLIRTTNTPGQIRVTVSSPGLAPETVTLNSTAPQPAAGDILQPHLADAGRIPVARDRSVVSTTPGIPPRVFDPIAQDYTLPATSPAVARASIEQFLHEHAVRLPRQGPAYDDAVAKLSQLLVENHGDLIADWYNFTANQYEDVAMLRAAIEKSSIAPEMRSQLERDYADRILLHGEPINAAAEAAQLAAVLDGARVVSTAAAPPAGVEHASAGTLSQLLAQAYPQWPRLDPRAQRQLIQLIYRFNPTLRTTGTPTLDRPLPQGPILLPALPPPSG